MQDVYQVIHAKELELARVRQEIDALRSELQGKPSLALLPDVQIYHKSVSWALLFMTKTRYQQSLLRSKSRNDRAMLRRCC